MRGGGQRREPVRGTAGEWRIVAAAGTPAGPAAISRRIFDSRSRDALRMPGNDTDASAAIGRN